MSSDSTEKIKHLNQDQKKKRDSRGFLGEGQREEGRAGVRPSEDAPCLRQMRGVRRVKRQAGPGWAATCGVQGVGLNSGGEQRPLQGRYMWGSIHYFFLLFDSPITSVSQVVSQNLSAGREHWGEEKGGRDSVVR